MGFGRRGWPLLRGEGRRYLEANVRWMFRNWCCYLFDRTSAPVWAGSTSACSSFGSPRKDKGREIQTLHFLSGPRRFPQKLQAGFHGRVALETINLNSSGEFVPAVVFNKFYDHTLKSDSMEGVLRLLAIHTCSPSFARWSLNTQRLHSPDLRGLLRRSGGMI